jgi:hypothetical protein
MEHIDLVGFISLGLFGGVAHCVGMCAPFVMIVSRQYARPDGAGAALAAQLWYNAGRILTYATLGGIAGVLGQAVDFAGAMLGFRQTALAIVGLVLVLWALVNLSALYPRVHVHAKWFAFIARTVKGRVPGHPLALGLVLGLLPCGLLYTAVVAAVSRGSAIDGAMAMALFGMGTAPALLGVSLADEYLARHRVITNGLAQVFVLLMGGWFVWRGIG